MNIKENEYIDKYTKIFKFVFFITFVINILLYASKKETILQRADYKILVQESEGSSNYVDYSSSDFPKNGYVLSSYECENGGVVTQNQTKALTFTGNADSCTLKFDINSSSDVDTLQLLQSLNPNIQVNSGTPNFSQMATTDEGLYSAEDDYGTSYYWRGAATTNYIKFGTNSNNQDLYWRIIRINGDGSLRLFYAGTSATAKGSIGESAFNVKTNDNGYLGYMYGNFPEPTNCAWENKKFSCASGGSTSYAQAHENINSSTMKLFLETWYRNNILNKSFEKYISDSEFCYDRDDTSTNGGYGNIYTSYAAYDRSDNGTPILTCTQKNDAFTVNDTNMGNGKLTYSIGLITLDEAIFAGTIESDNKENEIFYLHKGFNYTMGSPAVYANRYSSNQEDGADTELSRDLFCIDEYGAISYDETITTIDQVVPVINISQEAVVSLTGTGTSADPFVVH